MPILAAASIFGPTPQYGWADSHALTVPLGSPIPVIDLFAGPGGLGEGFSGLSATDGAPPFKIHLSIEKNRLAHQTLELRAFFRRFARSKAPNEYYLHLRGQLTRKELFDAYPEQANAARQEAWCVELGKSNTVLVRERIRDVLGHVEKWALIGGPPCQAYSVAGRSRRRGEESYDPVSDERQYLYQEYLQIIADHRPPVFVMENVKGLLSATLNNRRLFERILEDLQSPTEALLREGRSIATKRRDRYRIYSLVSNGMFGDAELTNFVVRAEHHDVPQARHRIILLGIRDDLRGATPNRLPARPLVPAGRVLDGLPKLRSGLSDGDDGAEAWLRCLRESLCKRWLRGAAAVAGIEVRDLIVKTIDELVVPPQGRGGEFIKGQVTCLHRPEWFLDDQLGGVCNHATRKHMSKDLHRYLYAACYTRVNARSPKLVDFPKDLLPDHGNVAKALNGGYFNDRFRVQLPGVPSSTITSHIAKDGHYYIHSDPKQCRALTVREAARLQTFPDNYFFCGSRTAQYGQVGNAVPPLMAKEIARIVRDILT